MIAAAPATRMFLLVDPVDMRKGFEGLTALVRHRLEEDPLSGHLFVFINAAHNRLKTLFWDGSGLWVCNKRIERGLFCWPVAHEARAPEGKLRLSAAELSMLVGGLDFARAQKRNWWRKAES